MFPPPTITDVLAALEPLREIKRPEGDNEGEAINSPEVYNSLSSKDRANVDHAEEVVREYVRKPGNDGDEPNKRAITELNKKGIPATLNADQYDPYKLVGRVDIGEWHLELSDGSAEGDDD